MDEEVFLGDFTEAYDLEEADDGQRDLDPQEKAQILRHKDDIHKQEVRHADERHKQHLRHTDEAHKQHLKHAEEAHRQNMAVAKTAGHSYAPSGVMYVVATPAPAQVPDPQQQQPGGSGSPAA